MIDSLLSRIKYPTYGIRHVIQKTLKILMILSVTNSAGLWYNERRDGFGQGCRRQFLTDRIRFATRDETISVREKLDTRIFESGIMSKKKEAACLFIHGFAGNNSEIEPLAKEIEAAGIDCKRTVLKGHGQDGVKLRIKGIGYPDWIDGARRDFMELKKEYEKIVVIGFSMGGLIGIQLCGEKDNHASALAIINTPYYFWNFEVIRKNITRDIKNKKADAFLHYFQMCVDKPFRSYFEFHALLNKSKAKIKDISCDLYIFQSIDDDTTHFKSAARICQLKRAHRNVEYFDSGGHHILENNPLAVKKIARAVVGHLRQSN
jgi:carboxylesterase